MTKKTQPELNEEIPSQEAQVEEEDSEEPSLESESESEVHSTASEGESVTEETSEEKRIAELEIELAEAKDQVLRSLAEVENTRKRASRDVVAARKSALKSFGRQLIQVADNFDRTLDAIAALDESEAEQPLIVGLRLTLKEFTATMNDAGIRAFNPKGEAFNPDIHEAVSMFPTEEAEPNSVFDVMRVGYFLNDELLRAAQVVVAQAPETKDESDEAH